MEGEALGLNGNLGGDAQAAEAERQLAGNVQDRAIPEEHGMLANPGGATAFQDIPYEGIPETVDQPPPPDVVARPDIPGPQNEPQGSSGGYFQPATATSEETQAAPGEEPVPGLSLIHI